MLYSPFSDSMVDWLSSDRVTVAIAANIQFESGTVYVHSGTGTLVIGGYVYYGMGRMGSVDDASETSTTSPTQVKMTLSGLDMALFATTLNERCVGRNAEIYLVAMDDNGVVQVADLLFKGRAGGLQQSDHSSQWSDGHVRPGSEDVYTTYRVTEKHLHSPRYCRKPDGGGISGRLSGVQH